MKRLIVFGSLFFLGLGAFAQSNPAPGEWRVRLRAFHVIPQESAEVGVIGGDAQISKSFIPELDFTYFFTKNLSAELILGTTRHKVKTTGSDLSAIGGPDRAEVNLGKVWLLPPTLTLQYHYPVGKFKPYVGAGVNYTIFYNADQGPVVQDISYKNRFAFAAQAGLDFAITDRMFINADLKKIFLSTKATVDAANLTPSENPELADVLGNIQADVKIRPWLIGVGLGYRF
ncbi:OmpW family protein [Pedobacter antarcticus 4BY]|uniref:OmpW family protein n=2 Tax=Pedobacter antarcticus TaxID=34086 RepID=A0A081PEH5_9SPHI|nr:OmpW family outer membrane protein [Pedobacter antarcticus]KEQ29098.1 OmpW family protein [Pedobacter antarcticus 4BY]SFE94051.1 outer membrane protein [Pedobacter antarcticus]